MKQPSRKYLRDKADKEFRDLVRARGYCQAAAHDTIVTCGPPLQCAHIEGRANFRLRWEPLNALCLCGAHHIWFTEHPIAWAVLIMSFFPENYRYVTAHMKEIWDKDYDKVFARMREA